MRKDRVRETNESMRILAATAITCTAFVCATILHLKSDDARGITLALFLFALLVTLALIGGEKQKRP